MDKGSNWVECSRDEGKRPPIAGSEEVMDNESEWESLSIRSIVSMESSVLSKPGGNGSNMVQGFISNIEADATIASIEQARSIPTASYPLDINYEPHGNNDEHDIAPLRDLEGFDELTQCTQPFNDNASAASLTTLKSTETNSVPHCPLTLDVIRDPVMCQVDGQIYERFAIEEWIRSRGTSPFTRAPVCMGQLKSLNPSDDDAASITTTNGWPSLNLGLEHQPPTTIVGSPDSVSSCSYLSALLTGGGGLESDRAKALTQRRRQVKKSSTRVPTRVQNQPMEENCDITDLIDDEYTARKLRPKHAGKWRTRRVIGNGGAYLRTWGIPAHGLRNLQTVDEASDDCDSDADL